MRFGSGRPSIEPAKLLPLGGPRAQHRFLSHAQSAPHSIAVLGGGITGLATASFLTRECTDAKVTLYEGSNRLGGWIQSKQVEVDGGTVLFEQGPRSLRGGIKSLKTLELVCEVPRLESLEG
jgi:protoporphyrinogen/coproporphyrinogen III oxidase